MSILKSIDFAEEQIREEFEAGEIEDVLERVYEVAGEAVPVMNNDIINYWTAIPNYDAEDYGGEYNIIHQMAAAIEEHIREELVARLADIID